MGLSGCVTAGLICCFRAGDSQRSPEQGISVSVILGRGLGFRGRGFGGKSKTWTPIR